MKRNYFPLLVFLFITILVNGQEISTTNLKAIIYYLADEKLQGRGTSTPGEKMAADYIAKKFKEYGLDPKGDSAGSYFYHFHNKYNPDKTDTVPGDGRERNGIDVAGYLDEGAENTIVIGAHFRSPRLGVRQKLTGSKPGRKNSSGSR